MMTTTNILLKLSNLLVSSSDIYEISSGIKKIVSDIKENNIFFYDYSSRKLKDVINNFSPIEDMYDETAVGILYNNLLKLRDCDYILDGCEVVDATLKSNEDVIVKNILIPMKASDSIFGMLDISFENKKTFSVQFLRELSVFANQMFLWIQNKILNDRLQVNSNFYDALRNIAKIIETQYELNYIIPLIGEMIDKFVSNHLIYIFIKEGSEFKLFWPTACRDKRIYDLISQMNSEYIISEDRKRGVFPLVAGKEIVGCIAAHSTIDKLSPKEIEYILQLTKQASITIERANVYAEVLKHATLDALTGLNNRRQFEVRLKQEYASATRQKHPLCAIMTDIDFFKKINDTYGHAMGDKVLKSVAHIIKEQLREYDIPSRYGGEEFCILLPQTKIEEANIVAQRLRMAVEKNIVDENQKISVTISIGLSQLQEGDTAEDLYKHADKALYEAKERGRNRVIVYEE